MVGYGGPAGGSKPSALAVSLPAEDHHGDSMILDSSPTAERRFLTLGAVSGFLSVALGAFGAHALRDSLPPDLLEIFHLHPATCEIHEPGYRPDVQWVSLQIGKNLPTPRPAGGGNRQQYFARPRVADHLIDMPGLVYLEPGNDPIGQVAIVVDEGNRAHRTAHS